MSKGTTSLSLARARIYCYLIGATPWAIYLAYVAIMAAGGLDLRGSPVLGGDFVSFYAASTLAISGQPAGVYDVNTHGVAERALFPGIGYLPFAYPPVFLIVCLPLAALPFGASLVAWLGVTSAAYVFALRKLAPMGLGSVPLLAFPAVCLNILHGQNAFLTTALFAGGLLTVAHRPYVAGALFGSLAFKPHLAILIPIYLAATGRWRALAAATGTTAALVGLSVLVFGAETWAQYLKLLDSENLLAREELLGNFRMQSVFAMLSIAGAPISLAYLGQALTGFAGIAALVVASRRGRQDEAAGLLVLATLLAVPYVLRYDLVLLTIPLVLLLKQGIRTGFRRGDILVGSLAYALPLVPLELAARAHVLVAPLVYIALLIALTRRAFDRASDLRPQASARSPT